MRLIESMSTPFKKLDASASEQNCGQASSSGTTKSPAPSSQDEHRHAQAKTQGAKPTDGHVSDNKAKEKDLEEELQKLRQEYHSLEDENDELRREVKYMKKENTLIRSASQYVKRRYALIVANYFTPYGDKTGIRFDDQSIHMIETFMEGLLQNALRGNAMQKHWITTKQQSDETGSLRAQLETLQNKMLSGIDKAQIVSDQHFEAQFRSLASAIKTVSRELRIPEERDVATIMRPALMLQNVEVHHWHLKSRKKCYVEAWLWCILIQCVFHTPFAVFGNCYKNLNPIWAILFGSVDGESWPTPTAASETWRYMTVERLVRIADRGTITRGHLVQPLSPLRASVLDARSLVSCIIDRNVTELSPGTKIRGISSIVDKAFTLSLDMALQRSRLQIVYPAIGDKFCQGAMCPRSDPNIEDIEDGIVAFVVNPGLKKWGDGYCKNLDQNYHIVPSLVQLETAKVKEEPYEICVGVGADVSGRVDNSTQGNVHGVMKMA